MRDVPAPSKVFEPTTMVELSMSVAGPVKNTPRVSHAGVESVLDKIASSLCPRKVMVVDASRNMTGYAFAPSVVMVFCSILSRERCYS